MIMALTCGFTRGAEGTRTPDPHTAKLRGDRPSTSAGVPSRRSEAVQPSFRTLADGGEPIWIRLNCYQNCSAFSHLHDWQRPGWFRPMRRSRWCLLAIPGKPALTLKLRDVTIAASATTGTAG
jgi:hypothetical protein